MVRAAEQGGGTYFSHQAAAYEALQTGQQEYWSRLSSVNSASGVVHPLVHQHPITGHRCVWLHLGMTGAVVEKLPMGDNFRLLDRDSLTQLCRAYASVLDEGIKNGYTTQYEYRQNDCVFVDNLAVAHRAAPQAHLPPSTQGTRILHRSTVRGIHLLLPLEGFQDSSIYTDQAPSEMAYGNPAEQDFAGTPMRPCRTKRTIPQAFRSIHRSLANSGPFILLLNNTRIEATSIRGDDKRPNARGVDDMSRLNCYLR